METVSDYEDSEGETHIIMVILAFPFNESLKTRVSFELLKGIWVLLQSYNVYIQYPSVDKDLFIEVSSLIRINFSCWLMNFGILNFSDPAKSTIRSLEIYGLIWDPLGYWTKVT